MTTDDTALWTAFRRTTFRAYWGDREIDIRVDGPAPSGLAELLAAKNEDHWAFITAWNPGGRVQSDEANQAANKGLRAELEERKLSNVFAGDGIPDPPDEHPPEASLLILGIERSDALEIGRKFGQAAIVLGRRGQPPQLVTCARHASPPSAKADGPG